MIGKAHRAEQRADGAAGRQVAVQRGLGTADLAFARQEGQQAAFGAFLERLKDQGGGLDLQPGAGGQGAGQPAGFDREGAAFGGDQGRVAHQGGHRGGVKRGGHDQNDQVFTQGSAQFQGEREAKIGVQRAFVKLVEDQHVDAVEAGV